MIFGSTEQQLSESRKTTMQMAGKGRPLEHDEAELLLSKLALLFPPDGRISAKARADFDAKMEHEPEWQGLSLSQVRECVHG